MGITYQTNNRQRRKVMTAPLNAPPQELATPEEPSVAQEVVFAPAPARPGAFWMAAAIAGAAVAAAALHFLL
jgi:hypothetical protein